MEARGATFRPWIVATFKDMQLINGVDFKMEVFSRGYYNRCPQESQLLDNSAQYVQPLLDVGEVQGADVNANSLCMTWKFVITRVSNNEIVQVYWVTSNIPNYPDPLP